MSIETLLSSPSVNPTFLKTPWQCKAIPSELSLQREGQWNPSGSQGGSDRVLLRGAKGKVVGLSPAAPPHKMKSHFVCTGSVRMWLSSGVQPVISTAECQDISSHNTPSFWPMLALASCSRLLLYFVAWQEGVINSPTSAPGLHFNKAIQKRAVLPVWLPAATLNTVQHAPIRAAFCQSYREENHTGETKPRAVPWDVECGGTEADGVTFSLRAMLISLLKATPSTDNFLHKDDQFWREMEEEWKEGKQWSGRNVQEKNLKKKWWWSNLLHCLNYIMKR